MSIKTTYDIDRTTALAVISSKLFYMTNDQLANVLEEFEESYFRNYWVHDKLPEDIEERSSFVIKDVSDF